MKHLYPQIETQSVPSVSELNLKIKNVLEPNFRKIWVKGEVSNLRQQASGHIYFSLKDSASQIPCVFFNRYANDIKFQLKEGSEILVYGDISIYEPYGRYQITVKLVELSGQGDLYKDYEKLKSKLKDEGLFAKEKKKKIPLILNKIALITSPTGAAIQDFIRILKRRNFCSTIDLFPVKVQGKFAKDDILKAIEYINQNPNYDCLILTRGGGSIEDLWTFNEEAVARAIFNCEIPSISGIGHEVDTVLTDLVADYRAETPSGAAEYISSNYLNLKERLINNANRFKILRIDQLENRYSQISTIQRLLSLNTPQNFIDKMMIQIDLNEQKLSQNLSKLIKSKTAFLNSKSNQLYSFHPQHKIIALQSQLSYWAKQINRNALNSLKYKQSYYNQIEKRLNNTSIQSNLKRGYVILKNKSNSIIHDLVSAGKEDTIKACFIDGELLLKKKKEEIRNKYKKKN